MSYRIVYVHGPCAGQPAVLDSRTEAEVLVDTGYARWAPEEAPQAEEVEQEKPARRRQRRS
jgi:hypothetical protein